MISKIFTLMLLLFSLTACGTVSRGATDYLRIDTVPQGATVTTTIETFRSRQKSQGKLRANKEYRGCAPTPCLLEIGRRQAFAIKIEHAGYEPAEIAIHGDIPLQTTTLDMAVPAGSVVGNASLGAAAGAFMGSMYVAFSQVGYQLLFFGHIQAPTSGIVAGATAAGAGVGVGMVGIDLISGSFENIYPNPVIIKLAPEGTPTLTDPNMLMFKLRRAKKSVARDFCGKGFEISLKQQKKNCKRAREIDRKRAIENADLLANGQEIKDLIKTIKRDLKAKQVAARKAKRAMQGK